MQTQTSEFDQLARMAGLMLSNMSVYGPDHALATRAVDECYAALSEALRVHGSLSVTLNEDVLRINGTPTGRNNPVVRMLISHLFFRGIGNFTLKAGISRQEFGVLASVLGADENVIKDAGGFAQAVTASQLPATAVSVIDAPPPSPAPEPERNAHASGTEDSTAVHASGGRMVLDFIIGFFGIPSMLIAAITVVGAVFDTMGLGEVVGLLLLGAAIAAAVAIPKFFIAHNRPYIAKGFLTFLGMWIIIPALLFGACLLIVTTQL